MMQNNTERGCIACREGEPFRDSCVEGRTVTNCSAGSEDGTLCRERDEMFYRIYDESRECCVETQRRVSEERTLLCAEGCTLTDAACVWRTLGRVSGSLRRTMSSGVLTGCSWARLGAPTVWMGSLCTDASACEFPTGCTTLGENVCLRCTNGLFADETCGCQCLRRARLTFSVR